MTTVKVKPPVLRGKAVTLRVLAEEYQQLCEQLFSEAHAAESCWEGQDSKAYIARLDEFRPDLENLVKLVGQYADFLDDSAEAYNNVQDGLLKYASRLRG